MVRNVYLYQEVMDKLQELWERDNEALMNLHMKRDGIRSSQIGALIILLIELGVIDPNTDFSKI